MSGASSPTDSIREASISSEPIELVDGNDAHKEDGQQHDTSIDVMPDSMGPREPTDARSRDTPDSTLKGPTELQAEVHPTAVIVNPHHILQVAGRGFIVRSMLGFRRQRMAKLRPASQLTTKRRELFELQATQRTAASKLQRWCRARLCRVAFLKSKPMLMRQAQKRFTERYRASQVQHIRSLVQHGQCLVQIERVEQTCATILDAALGRVDVSTLRSPIDVPRDVGSSGPLEIRVPSGAQARSQSSVGFASRQPSYRPASTASETSTVNMNRRRSLPGGPRSKAAARRIINALASSINRTDIEETSMDMSVGSIRRSCSAASKESESWNSVMTQWVSDIYSHQNVDVDLSKYPTVVSHVEEIERIEEDARRAVADDHAPVQRNNLRRQLVPVAILQRQSGECEEKGSPVSLMQAAPERTQSMGRQEEIEGSPKHTKGIFGHDGTGKGTVSKSLLKASAQQLAKKSMEAKDKRRLTYANKDIVQAKGRSKDSLMMQYALKRAAEFEQKASTTATGKQSIQHQQ